MAVTPTAVISAYARIQGAASGGLDARPQDGAGAFAGMVKEALAGAVDAGRHSEAVSAQAVVGEAQLVDVVTAVSNAELALETVVAVRDRVIQAYQDVLRMPI
ncbi:MAG: flagellar hook-basal body complex protein FliE [Alphaproteobacteria bacterium]